MTSGHKFLKVVKFHEFTNSWDQLDLVQQIIKFSKSLEKMALNLDCSMSSTEYTIRDVD